MAAGIIGDELAAGTWLQMDRMEHAYSDGRTLFQECFDRACQSLYRSRLVLHVGSTAQCVDFQRFMIRMFVVDRADAAEHLIRAALDDLAALHFVAKDFRVLVAVFV